MKQKTKQNGAGHKQSQMTAEKKKVVIAAALICVMAILWVRILAKKKDSSLSPAALAAQTAAVEETTPRIKVTYVELPQVKGRNDVLTRDVFASGKWEGMGAAANGATQFKSTKQGDNKPLNNTIETIGKELKLEAIFSGKNPQASVCGTLISPGGKLTVNYEGEQYEFKVVAIEEKTVVLECKGVLIKLTD
jgi:hypothetical protein